MSDRAQSLRIATGLHLNQGPIDLIVRAEGVPDQVEQAYDRAANLFPDILSGLVGELPRLRTDMRQIGRPTNAVSMLMYEACLPFVDKEVTPMAAVAGAVADFVLATMAEGLHLQRAWINNGGDIAFMLEPENHFTCGMISGLAHRVDLGDLVVTAEDESRGIATSGWATKDQGGRSYSLGIADSVTVLARSAADADVAATLIANRVDLPSHPNVHRIRAMELDPDSDLGDRLVTQGVPDLTNEEKHSALSRGSKFGRDLCDKGLIQGAVLFLQGEFQVVGAARRLPHFAASVGGAC